MSLLSSRILHLLDASFCVTLYLIFFLKRLPIIFNFLFNFLFTGTTLKIYNVNLKTMEVEEPFTLHAKSSYTLVDLKTAIEEVDSLLIA